MSPHARNCLGVGILCTAAVGVSALGLIVGWCGVGGHGVALGLMGLALDLVAGVWLVASEWPGVLPKVMYYLACAGGITVALVGHIAMYWQMAPAAVALAVLSWALFLLFIRLPLPD